MSNSSTGKNNNFTIGTIRDRADTLDLRYGIQPAHSGSEERWLVMSNGRTEWLEKYASLATDLNVSMTTGYIGFDHRGQGLSGGARAWIDSYTTYASDMAEIIHATTKGKPFNLVCHSMGCIIGLTAVMEGFIQPQCIVLSSPMLGLPHHPMPPTWAHKISRLISTAGFGHVSTGGGQHNKASFEGNKLTHSAEKFAIIKNIPYPVPGATFEWVRASYEATQAVLQPDRLKKLTMPILVLCGTDEHVVDVNAVQPWVAAAQKHAANVVDLQWIQGGRHELLFESKEYYEKTLETIRQWFTKVGCTV